MPKNKKRNNNGARGAPQNRKAAVSTRNFTTLTRKFVLNEKQFLNSNVGDNTILERTWRWDGEELQGFSAISAGFDQYRITRIQFFATPCTSRISTGGVLAITNLLKQPTYACSSTCIYSAVDVTGGGHPGVDIQAFQNCEFRQMQPHGSTKIADFRPKISSTLGLLYAPNTWVSTSQGGVIWNGVQVRVINSNGAFVFPLPDSPQFINFRSVVHVEFRHPIYDTAVLLTRLNKIQAAPALKQDAARLLEDALKEPIDLTNVESELSLSESEDMPMLLDSDDTNTPQSLSGQLK
jgi:hypothetical protein